MQHAGGVAWHREAPTEWFDGLSAWFVLLPRIAVSWVFVLMSLGVPAHILRLREAGPCKALGVPIS